MAAYKRLSPICRLPHEAKLKHDAAMRLIFLSALLLTACSEDVVAPSPAAGLFAGTGRDRLCISSAADAYRIGIVTYGEGDNNCTIQTKVTAAGHGSLVDALGDPACKFLIESDGTTLTLPERLPAACDYYCGPTAALAGKKFTRASDTTPATDLAGDPLC